MFFSAAETAYLSASRLHIRYLKRKKNRAARRADHILLNKTLLLNAILVGNNIVNIAISAILTALALELFGNTGIGIATGISTVLILLFGEILPKATALHFPEQVALRFSWPLLIFILISRPITAILDLFTRLVLLVSGKHTTGDSTTVTEDDLKSLIEAGEEEGILESGERKMLHNIFRYTDLTARDIMTPRTSIIAIPLNTTESEIFAISRSSSHSRFPVYGKDIDSIEGIIHIKDLAITAAQEEPRTARDLLRPPVFVFENQRVSILRNKLRQAGQNMAVVLDEYGGTAGIVTIEDLLEEIFGSIRDEFDKVEHIHKKEGFPMDLSGSTRLSEVEEMLGIKLESEWHETIAGLIMERLGDIPVVGSVIDEQGYTFAVVKTVKNRVETVRVDVREEG